MNDDDSLRSLVALARKMPHAEGPRRDAASFIEFEARLTQRGRGHRARIVWGLSALTTCAALLLAFPAVRGALLDPRGPPLSYRVQPLEAGPTGTASVSAQHELAFSDGSRVQLEARSKADVAELTRHGARVVLAHGRAEVSIARRKNAAWQLIAGPYTVRVTGTAFRLAWSRDQQELEVSMHHGSVVVTGPLAEQGVVLAAGQRLTGSPRTGRLLVESNQARPVALAAATTEATSRAQEPSVKATLSRERPRDPVVATRRAVRPDGEHGWAKQVAQGDFAMVLEEARALGVAHALEAATAVDLGALADAARYARQTLLGQKALLALRTRFPASPLSADSAFLLGRLSSDKSALAWYQRYLDEQPKGAYVSQALGRSMMLCHELGDASCAKRQAQTYLKRFVSGPYAASARKLSAPVRADPTAP